MLSKIVTIIVLASAVASYNPFEIEKSVGWQALRNSTKMALTLR